MNNGRKNKNLTFSYFSDIEFNLSFSNYSLIGELLQKVRLVDKEFRPGSELKTQIFYHKNQEHSLTHQKDKYGLEVFIMQLQG